MMQKGLIQFASNDQLLEQEREEAERQQKFRANQWETSLAAHFRRIWERNRDHHWRHIRPRILACMRARVGEYDPKTLAEIRKQGGSEIFMMLTATKCRAAAAWVRDILLPAADKAWGLEPTPVPDVPEPFKMKIRQNIAAEMQAQVQQQMQSGEPVDREALQAQYEERVAGLEKEVKEAAEERAQKAAERMELKIEDQLAEGGWESAMEDFIDDFTTFPVAYLKGPIKRRRPSLSWGAGWMPQKGYEIRHEWERVSPFDLYPSPGSVVIEDGELIEHVRYSRRTLYNMLGMPGFKDEAIRLVLDEYRTGLHEWLWEGGERASLEGRDPHQRHDDVIDALHIWGPVQGLLLLEWGVSPEMIEDPLGEYEVEAILIGRHVIRCEINDDPLRRRPYEKASFERVPGSWLGLAVPELMADIQRMCNATARSLANNMAFSSGPLVELYTDRLAPGEQVKSIWPWRILQMQSDPAGGANNRALNFYQPNSNAGELLAVFERFERMADDATNIPRYTYGNERVGGAGSTASGLSMLMESASKGIKKAISHIDLKVIRPSIEKVWYENMVYSDDQALKGDSKVVARGAAALIAKDSAQARRLEMLQFTGNPVDMQILGVDGRAEMLRDLFRNADMPDVIPPKEEIQKRLEQQAQQPGPDQREQDRKDQALELEYQHKEKELQLDERHKAKELELERREQELEAAELRLRYGAGGMNGAFNAQP